MQTVSVVTVLFEPNWQKTGKILRQAIAAAETCRLQFELLVIDNSPQITPEAARLAESDRRVRVVWNEGYNIYITGAMTKALQVATGDALIYVCASHGHARDLSWMTDILQPLQDPKVGMAGCVQPCSFSPVATCAADMIEPQHHVQGGVWAARRETLQSVGFGHRFPFEFCDVDLCRRLMVDGYRLANVPSIVSVAGGTAPNAGWYKYIHDYR